MLHVHTVVHASGTSLSTRLMQLSFLIPQRHWQTLISVPAPVGYVYVNSPSFSILYPHSCGNSHPTEPQCVYDPVDGFTLSPDTDPVEKIRILEEEICEFFDVGRKGANVGQRNSEYSYKRNLAPLPLHLQWLACMVMDAVSLGVLLPRPPLLANSQP